MWSDRHKLLTYVIDYGTWGYRAFVEDLYRRERYYLALSTARELRWAIDVE